MTGIGCDVILNNSCSHVSQWFCQQTGYENNSRWRYECM